MYECDKVGINGGYTGFLSDIYIYIYKWHVCPGSQPNSNYKYAVNYYTVSRGRVGRTEGRRDGGTEGRRDGQLKASEL